MLQNKFLSGTEIKKINVLSWEISVPLITNRYMVFLFLKVCLLSGAIMGGLLSLIFIVTGEWKALLPIWTLSGIVTGVLLVVLFLVMICFFGNKMPMRFTLNDKNLTCEITSKRAKLGNRIAIIVGILARRPGVAGAGMLGASQETIAIDWSDIAKAKFKDRFNLILLYNSWRQILMVHTTRENYEEVANFIKARIVPDKKIKNLLPQLLFRTTLTILACVPLFMWDDAFIKFHGFLPIFTLCFALATIWLTPMMGYVTISGVLYIGITLFWDGLRVHKTDYSAFSKFLGTGQDLSFLNNTTTTGFGYLDNSEWVGLSLLILGLAYLLWSSWKSIKGKYQSALFSS